MTFLKTIGLTAAMIAALSTFGQDSTDKKAQFTPEFNYLEAGITTTADARARSFTTNSLQLGNAFSLQHGGFHEAYFGGLDFAGLYTRNGFWGKKGDLGVGVVQAWNQDGALQTEAGLRLTKFPDGLYGFAELTTPTNALQPNLTLFAGKDFGKEKPLSVWYFTAGNLGDAKNMYHELQISKDLGNGFSAGVRGETFGVEKGNQTALLTLGKKF